MRRGQMPGAAAGEMGKKELHGASLVQATDTNKQDLPISHPSLPQAKSQHWLQLGQGATFSWADTAPPASALRQHGEECEEHQGKAPGRRQIALGPDIFSDSKIMDITAAWTTFHSPQLDWCTPRCLHRPSTFQQGLQGSINKQPHI